MLTEKDIHGVYTIRNYPYFMAIVLGAVSVVIVYFTMFNLEDFFRQTTNIAPFLGRNLVAGVISFIILIGFVCYKTEVDPSTGEIHQTTHLFTMTLSRRMILISDVRAIALRTERHRHVNRRHNRGGWGVGHTHVSETITFTVLFVTQSQVYHRVGSFSSSHQASTLALKLARMTNTQLIHTDRF